MDAASVTGIIQAVRNDPSRMSDSRDTSLDSSDYFEIASNKLKLKQAVDMKLIGGPRHKITIQTTTNSCNIYALIIIMPDPDAPTTVEIEENGTESDKVIDGLAFPSSSAFINNGKRFDFKITEYSNVVCAVQKIKDDGSAIQDLYLPSVSMTVGDDAYNLELNSMSCHSDAQNCVEMVSSGTVFDSVEDNKIALWAPSEPACVFAASFKAKDEMPAVFLEEQNSITYDFQLDPTTVGHLLKKYNGQLLNVRDDYVSVSRKKGGSLSTEVEIEDTDNMPPVFSCQPGPENCQDTLLHRNVVIIQNYAELCKHLHNATLCLLTKYFTFIRK